MIIDKSYRYLIKLIFIETFKLNVKVKVDFNFRTDSDTNLIPILGLVTGSPTDLRLK